MAFRRAVAIGLAGAVCAVGGSIALAGPGSAGAQTATPAVSCPPASDAYATAVLADSPFAYYRLGESAGPTLCDSSASPSNGTYSASGLTYGVAGALPSDPAATAVSADGSTSALIGTGGLGSGVAGDHDFTLEGWFKSNATVQNQILVAIGAAGNGNIAGLALWPTVCGGNGSDLGLDEYSSSNCWDTTTVGVNLFDQHWHYVAVTYSASAHQVTGYVDGVNLGAQTPNTTTHSFLLQGSAPFVGNWVDNAVNQPFQGAAEEIALYPSALSGARIAAHYAAAGYGIQSTGAPQITGTPVPGQQLSASTGSWSGSPSSFTDQWEDCDGSGANCTDISGATASTYTPTAADVGHTLRVLVTAHGAGTPATATSAATAVVQAATTTTTTTTASSSSAPVGSPDLAIGASHIDPYSAGATGVYHVQLSNRGTAATSGTVVVTATLPPGITLASASSGWACAATGSSAPTVRCSYGGAPIAAGTGITLDLSVGVAHDSAGGRATFTVSDPGDGDSADKVAADATTVAGAPAVSATLTGAGAIDAGATTTLRFALHNDATALAPGTTVDFTITPSGPGASALAPSAAGSGWSCSTITAGGVDVVHCADTAAVAPSATASALALAFHAAAGTTGAAVISYGVHSASGGSLAQPVAETLRILAAAPANLTLTLNGPSTLSPSPEAYELILANAGPGATTGPATITLALPPHVGAGTASGSGWTCAPTAAGPSCVHAGVLTGGETAAPVLLRLTGTPGGRSPVALSATASTSDALGPRVVHASLSVQQPTVSASHPVITVTQLPPPTATTTKTARYAIVVSNDGSGASGSAPLTLTEQLPAGVTAHPSGPGWACAQQSSALSCTYHALGSGTAVLTAGAKTPALDVTLTGTSDFAGGAVPVSSVAQLQSNNGTTHSSVSMSAITVPAVAALTLPLSATVSASSSATAPGGHLNATFAVLDSGALATTQPVAVALVLPAGVIGPANAAFDTGRGVTISPDETLPAAGSANTSPVPISGSAAHGVSCESLNGRSEVVCAAPSLAAHSEVTVTVPLSFATTDMGTETLSAGLVAVNDTSATAELTDAGNAITNGGVSALGSPSTVPITIASFLPDAGHEQRLSAGREQSGGSVSPTSVQLAATDTIGSGTPLTYGWVQTSGPPITWAPSAAGQTPGQGGSTLPAYPSSFSFKTVTPAVYGKGGTLLTPAKVVNGTPTVYGPRPSFNYAGAASLTMPTVFGFEVYVTDGNTVRTASTSVTLDPLPSPPPLPPKLCLWDYTRSQTLGAATCLTASSAAPAPGDTIIAGPSSPYLYEQDSAGHALTYSWQVTEPVTVTRVYSATASPHGPPHVTTSLQSTPLALAPVSAKGVPACANATVDCFHWPSGVAVLGLQATITNGQVDAQGNPEQAVASVTEGMTPAPLAVSVATAPSAPVVAGATATLTASITGSNGQGFLNPGRTRGTYVPVTYAWTQTGGPPVSGLPTSGVSPTLSFTAPAPTTCAAPTGSGGPCGQTVTFGVTATQGSGGDASTGTGTVTVALLPAAPLAVSVASPSGAALSVAAGGQLALQASGSGGSGAGYEFSWSVASGGGSVAAASTPAGGADATYTAPSATSATTASLTVTVRPAGAPGSGGPSASETVPILVGAPSFPSTGSSSGTGGSSGASAGCPSGGPLASILGQLSSASAVLTLGPVTLDIPKPSGAVPSCAGWSASTPSLAFSAATITIGPFTMTGVAGSVSTTGITLTSATISAPSSWDLGTGAISQAITIPFAGAPTGAITWTGALPGLAASGVATQASTTVTLASDSAALTAKANVAGGTVTLTANGIGLTGTPSFTITASFSGLSVLGGTASGNGSVSVSDGSASASVTITASHLTPVSGITISMATLSWNGSGLMLSADASLANGAVALSLNGSYDDSSDWSATATLAPGPTPSRPSWLPSGVSLAGASVSGAVSDAGGDITFDVKLGISNPWSFTGGGATLQVANLTAEFSNATPPSGCAPLSIASGSMWLNLGGTASVTLGSDAPLNVTANACLDPGNAAFVLTTSGLDGFTPVSGVTFNGLSLTIASLSSGVSVTASGEMTVDGVTAAGAIALQSDGSIIAIGAVPNLSQLGLPLGNSAGAVLFTTDTIPDLGGGSSDSADQQSLLATLFSDVGLTQSDFSDVTVDGGNVAVLGDFKLPAKLTCLLDASLYSNPCPADGTPPTSGNAAPSSIVVSAQLGGVPTITGTLSAGPNGLTLFHVGQFSVALNDIQVQIALDGSFSLNAGATLTLPPPVPPGGTPPAHSTSCASPGSTPHGANDDCSQLAFSVGVSLDLTGPTVTVAGTVTGCDSPTSTSLLCNAFGVNGLDIGDLAFQLGLDFSSPPIITPTLGFAARVNAVPCSWANAIGEHELGCGAPPSGQSLPQGCSIGEPCAGAPGSTPMAIAVNLADTAPIFAFQIGTPGATTPAFTLGSVLKVYDAGLVVAPAGGTIGVGPSAVTYQPGFSLSFDGKVLGVPVSVMADVDPLGGSVKANASVGTIAVGPVTLQNATFNLDVGVTSGIDFGFSGGLSIAGGPTLAATASVMANASSPPSFSLMASGGNVDLGGGVLTLDNFNLSAVGSLSNGSSSTDDASSAPGFSLMGSATASLLNHSFAIAGGVTLTAGGITSASFYANPGNNALSFGGPANLSLTGPGCGSSAPQNVQGPGPCVMATYSSGAATPLSLGIDAAASFNGVGVSFQGSVDSTGIDITNATATIADPLDPNADRGHEPPQQTVGNASGELSGRLWLDAAALGASASSGAGDLSSQTAVDPATGQPVAVHSGDFEVSGMGSVTLAGFAVQGNFSFGALGDSAGGAPNVFAMGSLNVALPGGSVALSGGFSSDGRGDYNYDISSQGNLVGLGGYTIADATVDLSSNSGLTVNGSFSLPGATAALKGNLSDQNGSVLYSVSGQGSLEVPSGPQLAGYITIANEDQNGNPLGYTSGTVNVNASYGSSISFNASATVNSDGSVCQLQGTVTILSFSGTATYCDEGGSTTIGVSISDYGFSIGGNVSGTDFHLTGTADSGDSWSWAVSPSLSTLYFGGSGSASFDFKWILDSQSGPSFSVDGHATLTGYVPGFPTNPSQIGPFTVGLSGSPGDVCATISPLEVCGNSNGANAVAPNPPFSS